MVTSSAVRHLGWSIQTAKRQIRIPAHGACQASQIKIQILAPVIVLDAIPILNIASLWRSSLNTSGGLSCYFAAEQKSGTPPPT